MRLTTLSLLAVAVLSAPAFAGGHDEPFRRYPDRGHRYVDSSRPSWGITFGYSTGGYYDDDSFAIRFSYSDGPRYRPVYPAPVYCPPVPVAPPPVVYYPRPVYCPPPIVVYPRPEYPHPWYRGGYVYHGGSFGYYRW